MDITKNTKNKKIKYNQKEKKDSYAAKVFVNNIKIENCHFDPRGENGIADEGVKASLRRNITFVNCTFISGKEDALDAVRGENLSFIRCHFHCHGNERTVTIKGGAKNILFQNCQFYGKPKFAHIKLGDYTIYDMVKRPKVRNVHIKYCQTEDKGQLYTAWHSEKPKTKNNKGFGNKWYMPKKLPDFLVKIYFWMNRKGWFSESRKLPPEQLKIYEWELS